MYFLDMGNAQLFLGYNDFWTRTDVAGIMSVFDNETSYF